MRISLNNVWLTNDGVADLRVWTDAREVRLDGRQIVQDAQFLRAVSAQPLARGNRIHRLRFTVTRQHASVAEAAAHVLTAFSALPADGTATVICGAYGETPVTCTFAAALEEVAESRFQGVRTDTTFVLRGGLVTLAEPGTDSLVDGASFGILYGYPQGGSPDGGNLADALSPSGLNLDGGGLS